MRPSTRSIVLAAVLAAAGTAAAQDVVLTPADIQAQLVGKKLFSRGTASGVLADFWLRADNTVEVAWNGGSDTGTWRFEGSGYCTKYKRLRNGAEACFTVVRRGGSLLVLNPDKTTSAEILKIVD